MSYWAVAQTEPQREHAARLLLMRGRPEENVSPFETYAPRIKDRGRIAFLFPAYLFVRIVERWYPVRWTPGIVRICMAGDHPAPVPDEIVDAIRKREVGGFVRLPQPRILKPGDKVRVTRGSFEGRLGIYAGMASHERQRALLELLGQMVPVEFPPGHLAPQNVAPG